MAHQCSQLVLQAEAAQQIWLLAWKELDQKIYIAVFAPIAESGPEKPEVEDFVDRQSFLE